MGSGVDSGQRERWFEREKCSEPGYGCLENEFRLQASESTASKAKEREGRVRRNKLGISTFPRYRSKRLSQSSREVASGRSNPTLVAPLRIPVSRRRRYVFSEDEHLAFSFNIIYNKAPSLLYTSTIVPSLSLSIVTSLASSIEIFVHGSDEGPLL